MKEKLISVIIPVYNVKEYLRDCIDSVLAQSISDYEVILVNDGSTDGSGELCDQYAEKYPQIHTVHQQNQGVSVARNTGLAFDFRYDALAKQLSDPCEKLMAQ